ncbi:MAG: SDR family NAD(P)-dependent oxidoreductase, partial [Desulfobacterales bacterium]|nr:SDR family NAD(P)-dependent oxidoreductase [Desulfobacterales bacterium]
MIQDQFSLKDKTAIVTGASRGLGKAMALALAKAGADLVIAARTAAGLEETAHDIEKIGRKAIPVKCNVMEQSDIQQVINTGLTELNGVDILVNNAGISIRKSFRDIEYQDWQRQMMTNLDAVFFACKAVGAHMVKKRSGKVINIASVMAERVSY